MPTVLELADRFHDALVRRDVQALSRIIQTYSGIQSRLSGEIDALAADIERMGKPSRAQVMKLERYKRLMAETQDEIDKFTTWMEQELPLMGREYVGRGLVESRALMAAALNDEPVLVARFRDLPPETVERLLGFLDPSGPLYARLKLLPGFVADAISRAILEHVAMGRNPRVLARELTRAFGMGLSDALRMARTVQIYSYREASRANYVANNHVVKGWIWYAKLDSSTCISCISQHGSRHELSEPLRDHHSGRCTQLPVTILNPQFSVDSGESWFNAQDDATKKKMMGAGMYEAWKGGKIDFASLSKPYDDEVYGTMLRAATLKDLLSE